MSQSLQEVYAKQVADKFGHCPACGSRELGASDYDGGKSFSYKVECGKCGLTWVECFRFTEAIDFTDKDGLPV